MFMFFHALLKFHCSLKKKLKFKKILSYEPVSLIPRELVSPSTPQPKHYQHYYGPSYHFFIVIHMKMDFAYCLSID